MKRWTWIVVLTVFVFVIGYDIAMAAWFPGATISALTNGFAGRYPGAAMGLCLGVGYLLGHLFWPQFREVGSGADRRGAGNPGPDEQQTDRDNGDGDGHG